MTNMSHTYDWLALIEKRLLPHEQKLAEVHLAVCAQCRAEVSELTGLASDLKTFSRVSLPAGQAAWPALWARVQRPPSRARPYPTRQLAACLSLITVCLIFSNAWAARLAGGKPLTKGVDQPQTQIMVETPQPPGSVAELREDITAATQPIETNSANTSAAPRAVPIATPVPGSTS